MSFKLPDLSYDYNALEPSIDARTMEIHHSKHHAGYTANLNKAVEGTSLEGKSVEEILSGISSESAAVRNNGGGYYNHNLYWSVMGPNAGGEPTGELLSAINGAFGSPCSHDDLLHGDRVLAAVGCPDVVGPGREHDRHLLSGEPEC